MVLLWLLLCVTLRGRLFSLGIMRSKGCRDSRVSRHIRWPRIIVELLIRLVLAILSIVLIILHWRGISWWISISVIGWLVIIFHLPFTIFVCWLCMHSFLRFVCIRNPFNLVLVLLISWESHAIWTFTRLNRIRLGKVFLHGSRGCCIAFGTSVIRWRLHDGGYTSALLL